MLKIRVPGGAKARQSEQSEPPKDVPRKRRKVIEDDDDDDDEGEYAEGRSAPPARRSQPAEVERLFDDDDDVDVTGTADDMHDRPPRSPSPTNPSSRLQKRSAKAAFGEPPSKKRSKKKANVVYTDEEEDEYHEETGKGYRDDRDEDFVVDSPPQRKQSKKPATSVKGKGKGVKGKGDVKEKEIMVKDERKHVVQTTSAESATVNSKASALKRRIEAISEKGSEDTIIASQSSSASTLAVQSQSQSQPQDSRPPPQKKKLPTIKKNKTSMGAQAATQAAQLASKAGSANSAPAEAKTTLGSSLTPAFGVNLPKKPRTVPTIETADVDLSSPDVYASLFKTSVASTPRAGVNTKNKEEERRKELHKMRDEARAARLAELERNTFDLLAGQEKVARFESQLKERNSPALYPNHLASAIKYLVQSGKIPL